MIEIRDINMIGDFTYMIIEIRDINRMGNLPIKWWRSGTYIWWGLYLYNYGGNDQKYDGDYAYIKIEIWGIIMMGTLPL